MITDGQIPDISILDRGCVKATRFLHHSSCCLECPFEECVLVKPLPTVCTVRRQEIKKRYKDGMSIDELALMFKIHRRTVGRAIGRK